MTDEVRLTRRSMLKMAGASAAALAVTAGAAVPGQAAGQQAVGPPGATAGWRFCGRCAALFLPIGYQTGGCPAGGLHQPLGWMFSAQFNTGGDPHWQTEWRRCTKCHSLYFEGYPDPDGRCSQGGDHTYSAAEDKNYVLRHDVGEPPWTQMNWRFCGKNPQGCSTLFYDGYANFKGVCPVSGGHSAAGYNFALSVVSYNPYTPPWP